jgi:hypothetical protein
MNRRSFLVVAALVTLPAGALAAGETKQAEPSPTASPPDATVTLGVEGQPIDFDLPTNRHWIAYCTHREGGLGGTDIVTIQEMQQTIDGWRYGPSYRALATDEYANLQPGDAIQIDPNVVNKGS